MDRSSERSPARRVVEPLDEATRSRLQRQKQRDTAPEVAVRSALHRAGLRFRVDFKPLPDHRFRADIVFTRAKVAVFIDGCFWHGCPVHGRVPRNNQEWWAAKLDANRRRDERTTATLLTAGWLVLRYWEHETPASVCESIVSMIKARRDATPLA